MTDRDPLADALAARAEAFGKFLYEDQAEDLARAAREHLIKEISEAKDTLSARLRTDIMGDLDRSFWTGKLAGMDTAAYVIRRNNEEDH